MNTNELIEAEDKYFINTFARQPIVLDHGKGVKVWDKDGNEYIDMFAGIAVNALGHAHPKLVNALQGQVEKLIHVSNIYYNELAIEYAKKFIIDNLKDFVEIASKNVGMKDYKTVLQEKLQVHGEVKIKYVVLKEEGPDHDKTFIVEVSCDDKFLATGKGKNKKHASMEDFV